MTSSRLPVYDRNDHFPGIKKHRKSERKILGFIHPRTPPPRFVNDISCHFSPSLELCPQIDTNPSPDIGIDTDPSDAAFEVGDTASLTCIVKYPTSLSTEPSIEWIRTYSNGTEESVESTDVSFDGNQPTGTATMTFNR